MAIALAASAAACAAGCGGGGGGGRAEANGAGQAEANGAGREGASPQLTRDVPAVVRFDCREAARRMSSGVVYCPPLVPRGRTRSQNRSSRGRVSIDARDDEYVLNFVSPVLAGMDGSQPKPYRRHLGHWLVASADRRRRFMGGPGTRVVRRVEVESVPVTLIERRWVAPSLDAGHVQAVWSFGGRAFELSLHGFENRRALLDMVRPLVAEMRNCAASGGASERETSGCSLAFPAENAPRAGGDRVQVAECARGPIMAGSGTPDWRRRSIAAGPLGVLRRPLARMSRTGNGQLIAKLPVLVEGTSPVELSVPARQRHRIFLYYGRMRDRRGRPTTQIGRAPGFSVVRFEPCGDRPRTVWLGGIRVKGRRPVRLTVTVEGGRTIPLRLGRPQPIRG